MVPVKCILLNPINKYTKEIWPTKMLVRPLKGDMVRSESGEQWLRVINVCHRIFTKNSIDSGSEDVMGLEVYLNK